MPEKPYVDSPESIGYRCQTPLDLRFLQAQRLEAIGALAGGIAHEFKNLLTVAQGYIEVAIAQCQPGETGAVYLEKAAAALRQSKRLTNHLSQFSKARSSKKNRLDFARVLRNAVNFAVGESNITTRFVIDEGLWPVHADEGQIVQVIQHIVANAKQAMPSGGVIEAAAGNKVFGPAEHSVLGGGHYVRVSITDHGDGILPEHIAAVFDPFFTTRQGCSGLGLSLSYYIINNHKGHIAVASEPGDGTTITFYLPAPTDSNDRNDCSQSLPGRN